LCVCKKVQMNCIFNHQDVYLADAEGIILQEKEGMSE